MKWLDDIADLMHLSLSKLQEIVKEREAWCAAVFGVTKSQTWQSNWTIKTTLYPHEGEPHSFPGGTE